MFGLLRWAMISSNWQYSICFVDPLKDVGSERSGRPLFLFSSMSVLWLVPWPDTKHEEDFFIMGKIRLLLPKWISTSGEQILPLMLTACHEWRLLLKFGKSPTSSSSICTNRLPKRKKQTQNNKKRFWLLHWSPDRSPSLHLGGLLF